MSTILFATTQLAIAELALTLNINPFDVQGMGRNINYRLPDETWVNPKPTMTSVEQFQALYESAHYYRLFVASNPVGTNQRTGKSNGKAMYAESYVQSAQQTTNGDIFNMFKKFGVKRIGETPNTVTTSTDNVDVKVKIERLRLLKNQGTITALEFAEMCTELQDNAPSAETKSVDVTAKIRKSDDSANKPIPANDSSNLPKLSVHNVKGNFFRHDCTNAKRKEIAKRLNIESIEIGETFSATLLNDKNDAFMSQGKFEITSVSKTGFSVQRYNP